MFVQTYITGMETIKFRNDSTLEIKKCELRSSMLSQLRMKGRLLLGAEEALDLTNLEPSFLQPVDYPSLTGSS